MQAMSIHGSHCWETSFAIQSMAPAVGDKPELRDTIYQGYKFLVEQQQVEDWKDSPPSMRFSRLGRLQQNTMAILVRSVPAKC